MSSWTRWSTLRFCTLALCISCLAAGSASRAEESQGDLIVGEAYVVIKVTGNVWALTFQRFQRAESFVAEHGANGRLLRVKAGRYYLKSVTSIHTGLKAPPNPEPPEPSQTIVIREGVVNYLGDWKFSEVPTASEITYDIERAFNLETAHAVATKYRKTRYGLVISKEGQQPIKAEMPN